MAQPFYELQVEQVFAKLGATKQGLTSRQAAERLKRYGPNEFSTRQEVTAWQIFLNQFSNFFVLLLLGAAALSWLVGDHVEVAIILVVVVVNVVVGFIQEYKAEHALRALRQLLSGKASVIRDGKLQTVAYTDLVPGDIIVLKAGDKVSADARLFEVDALKVDEAALTGESTAVTKHTAPIHHQVEGPDQLNMVFAGTLAVAGRGQAVVVGTGEHTQFGTIAKLVQGADEPSPLELRLRTIGQWFTIVAAIIGVVVFTLSIFRGGDLVESFTFVIALLVAAVPESLPTIVTLSLALGVVRLAKQNSIVRQLPVVETLGDIDVIATDKTGTLTKNEMTITQVLVVAKSKGQFLFSQVTGVGFDRNGRVVSNKVADSKVFQEMALASILCNDASLQESKPQGDPTEVALVVLAAKAKFSVEELRQRYRRIAEIPFDPGAKYMATLHEAGGTKLLAVKGALEVVAAMSKLSPAAKQALIEQESKMAKQGLRVLSVAVAATSQNKIPKPIKGLKFLGLVGMLDPVREGVKESLAATAKAGIRTIIITGDHKLTTQAIARQLGMSANDEDLVEGRQVAEVSNGQLREMVRHVEIFARAMPATKLRIVEALKANGDIVAVTGDGVNDAPALKSAHVGIAMGKRGTDVAKETSDLVLLDDSFATIVKSVEFGRGVFDNIRKFITLLLAGNLDEILLVAVAALVGWPAPFTTVQILWINLVTDSFPALALGFQPPAAGILKDKPHQRNRGIISLIFSRSLALAGFGFIAALIVFRHFFPQDIALAQTVVFTLMVFYELVIVFPLFRDRPISQPGQRPTALLYAAVIFSLGLQFISIYGPLAKFFGTVPLQLSHWLWILGFISVGYLFAELLNYLQFNHVTSQDRPRTR